MRNRCLNPNAANYADYGGRGITIDPAWDSYEQFLADMDERPSQAHSIERVDVDGPYTAANCRWAVAKQQNRNRRSNIRLTYAGRTQCIAAWAEERDLPSHVIAGRVKRGWDIERALSTPKRAHHRAASKQGAA